MDTKQYCLVGVFISASPGFCAEPAQARDEPADMIEERFAAAFYAHEPIYVILGGSPKIDLRYQLSFKVRMTGDFYLGYTQNNHWDILQNSAPFRDTTHNPSIFWYQPLPPKDLPEDALSAHTAAGYEHASNGRDGDASRSMDTLFVKTTGYYGARNASHTRISVKPYYYLQKSSKNSDIGNYRRNLDIELGYFKPNSFGANWTHRLGKGSKGSNQIDISYAMRKLPGLSDSSGYLHFQVFQGYGETIAAYNQKGPTQFRLGWMLERATGRTWQ